VRLTSSRFAKTIHEERRMLFVESGSFPEGESCQEDGDDAADVVPVLGPADDGLLTGRHALVREC